MAKVWLLGVWVCIWSCGARAQAAFAVEADVTGAVNAAAGLAVRWEPSPTLLVRAYAQRRFRAQREVIDYAPIAATSRDDAGGAWALDLAYRVRRAERPDARLVPYAGVTTYRLWRDGSKAVCLLNFCDTSTARRQYGQYLGGVVGYGARVSASAGADLYRRRPHARVVLGWRFGGRRVAQSD